MKPRLYQLRITKYALHLCVVFTLIVLSTTSAAYEIHSPRHCLAGCPSSSPLASDLIIRDIYILSSNDLTKMADWVAYKVTKDTVGKPQKHSFSADPLLDDSETLEPEDYKGVKGALYMTLGSQVPIRSFAGSPYWKETYFMSNFTPQNIDLDKGPWRDLEVKVRALAKSPEIFAVYVMSGPLFEGMQQPLPNANEIHLVPSGYWKIVALKRAGKIKTAAFYFDQHTPENDDYCTHMVNIEEIEHRSGLTFFHELSLDHQIRIKRSQSQIRTEMGC